MLSRSDSCGPAEGYRASRDSGAVLERPVCESFLGITTASWSQVGGGEGGGGGGGETWWRSREFLLDLTGMEGEVLSEAGGTEDMERTLVRLDGLVAGLVG